MHSSYCERALTSKPQTQHLKKLFSSFQFVNFHEILMKFTQFLIYFLREICFCKSLISQQALQKVMFTLMRIFILKNTLCRLKLKLQICPNSTEYLTWMEVLIEISHSLLQNVTAVKMGEWERLWLFPFTNGST